MCSHHKVLNNKNLEYKLKCSTFNYKGYSNLTQNIHYFLISPLAVNPSKKLYAVKDRSRENPYENHPI
jgi:hypothetical protein